MKVLKFREHLTEAKTPRGAEFENIICAAYNMKSLGQDKEKAIESAETQWKPLYDEWLEVGNKIVDNSFPSPKGTMKHFGASSAPLTDTWESYFIKTTGKKASASTKTPKTDMYIGDQHISLKKYGGSQLMSGGKAETLATFAHAYNAVPYKTKTKALDEAWNKLADDIERDFVQFKLPKGGRINDFKSAIKEGVDDKLTNWVKDKLQKQSAMTDALRDLLNNEDVNKEVVREAMTGNAKFADALPKANYIMKFDEEGNSKYIKIDEKYTAYVASQTQFNISFKTSGTGGTAWTATKGIFKESVGEVDLVAEAYEHATQECLEEGIFDKVGKAVRKGATFFKNVLKKMLAYIWKKVKALIASSIEFVQKILGVKMDVSNGNPTVKF